MADYLHDPVRGTPQPIPTACGGLGLFSFQPLPASCQRLKTKNPPALRARGLLSKIVAIVTVMVSVPSIVLAVSEQLSYAKPLTIEWFEANVHGDGLHVYGTTVDPGVDIHLWVASEDGKSNRLFSLPWTQGLNDSLEAAARALALGGGELRLKKDPSKADDEQGPLMFYPEAWPEPPPKDGGPEVQPRVFVPNVVA